MRILPHGLVIAFDFESGQLPLDVEVAHLAEVEQPLVEARPLVHATAVHVVREVVDGGQPRALRVLVHARQRHEVDVVDRDVPPPAPGAPG